MRTVRLLTVCPLFFSLGVCILGRASTCVVSQGGTCIWVASILIASAGCIYLCCNPLPPWNRMTLVCENITFPILRIRVVRNSYILLLHELFSKRNIILFSSTLCVKTSTYLLIKKNRIFITIRVNICYSVLHQTNYYYVNTI